ncbi:transposon Tf2-9 polyprotein [Trichonephila clavata]|uniref:Transposon Tf2-9 polyprotein n=1 Tax=Trichonephila clavata TaxID=2740835 RepID=A0A8X6M2M7_TRICU|nr:transposon Tf2-9 polyprotein [Trichonephila clavata]
MDRVKVFMDDARITGSDEISLEEFFKKCREHRLKLNLNKSKFFKNEINFLGHGIDSKGLHKTNEKISAVVNAPVPKNVHERFPSAEVRENNSNIQHAETAEDISKDLNKELSSSSVQGVPSTDFAVPDLSQSSAKETDYETRSPAVPDIPFPRRSWGIRRPPERLVL